MVSGEESNSKDSSEHNSDNLTARSSFTGKKSNNARLLNRYAYIAKFSSGVIIPIVLEAANCNRFIVFHSFFVKF